MQLSKFQKVRKVRATKEIRQKRKNVKIYKIAKIRKWKIRRHKMAKSEKYTYVLKYIKNIYVGKQKLKTTKKKEKISSKVRNVKK